MGAEVYAFHLGPGDAVAALKAAAIGPDRIVYFCDSHAKKMSEKNIGHQCVPPSLPTEEGLVPIP
jgi:hypothetical protein